MLASIWACTGPDRSYCKVAYHQLPLLPTSLPLGKIWRKPKLIWQPSPGCAQGKVLVLNSCQQCLLKYPFPAAPQDSSLMGFGHQTRERDLKALQVKGCKKSQKFMSAVNTLGAISQFNILLIFTGAFQARISDVPALSVYLKGMISTLGGKS